MPHLINQLPPELDLPWLLPGHASPRHGSRQTLHTIKYVFPWVMLCVPGAAVGSVVLPQTKGTGSNGTRGIVDDGQHSLAEVVVDNDIEIARADRLVLRQRETAGLENGRAYRSRGTWWRCDERVAPSRPPPDPERGRVPGCLHRKDKHAMHENAPGAASATRGRE